MRLAILAFAAGVLALQLQARLPQRADLSLMALACLALFGLRGLLRTPRGLDAGAALRRFVAVASLLSASLLAGFVWAAAFAQLRLADELPAASEGADLAVVGVVNGLPQRFENGWRFAFAIESSSRPAPRQVLLSWYRATRESDEDMAQLAALHAGERWRFTVRLKRPHGNVNPQGYDYEAWLLENGIRATGAVRNSASPPVRLASFVWRADTVIERLRERIRQRIEDVLGAPADDHAENEDAAPYAGILVALAVGDQRAIPTAYWQNFARSGITHLMSISGLHVTMFAGLALALTNLLWRRSRRLPLIVPAQKAAALAGILAALLYALLAGFEAPAQRTLYMLAVVGWALISGRNFAASRILALALLLVLLLDPWAVLAAGFWLSFGAVGILFYAVSQERGHWLAAWGRAQWAVTIGSIPALLMLFQQFSLVSPLANAVAIPLVSYLITPLTLLGCVPPFAPLLHLAHGMTAGLMRLIDWLAATPWAVWQQHAPPLWALFAGCLGVAWLLLPRGAPARWLGLALCLPLVLIAPPRPMENSVRITVLDVGQGLAAHVQTARHDLIYDTGPAYALDANSGNRIILPYLRAAGVAALDLLIVSHADKDHSGGAQSLLDGISVARLLDSLPAERGLTSHAPRADCIAGQSWDWDGVHFALLHPPAAQYIERPGKTNDMSCVLKVSAGGQSMLLTSDIEAKSERLLLLNLPAALQADVVTVPHHGSHTSSTAPFIAAVKPKFAVFPVGYRNRFGHPKEDVAARWRESGAVLHRTDLEGALSFTLADSGISWQSARAQRPRYWYGR